MGFQPRNHHPCLQPSPSLGNKDPLFSVAEGGGRLLASSQPSAWSTKQPLSLGPVPGHLVGVLGTQRALDPGQPRYCWKIIWGEEGGNHASDRSKGERVIKIRCYTHDVLQPLHRGIKEQAFIEQKNGNKSTNRDIMVRMFVLLPKIRCRNSEP